MSLIESLLSAALPIRPVAFVRAAWASALASVPHLAILAGIAMLAWRAVLVAEPAGLLVTAPLPVSSPPQPGSHLVVFSANLQHGFPRFSDLEERLEAFARLVESRQADVLLLQEVARTGSINVDEWLRDRLGMAYVYARANGHQAGIGFEEGVAIFSRYPITAPEVKELPGAGSPFSRRVALTAGIVLPGQTIQAFSVHLGIGPAGNEVQIAALQDWASAFEHRSTVIVGGDFNAEPQTDRIRSLQSAWTDTSLAAGLGSDAVTHVLTTPWGSVLREHRLDYIFVLPGEKTWSPVHAEHLETFPLPHSDHRVVVAELAVQDPVPSTGR